MDHFCSLEGLNVDNVWLTIGSFDGVHRGHQAIISRLVTRAHAERSRAVVLTFHPHPTLVLRNQSSHFYLTSPDERANLMSKLGVDIVITHPFNQEVARLSAREFILRLQKHLDIRHLCAGHDFALGRNREGDLTVLKTLGSEFGFSMNIVQPVLIEGEVVSSSRIRSALNNGDISLVNQLLGRSYEVNGEVIHGDGRGRLLNIPTANLDIWKERAVPKAGVYACQAVTGEKTWKAVTNIGFRPTFNPDTPNIQSLEGYPNVINQLNFPHVEAHLLDFHGDLYQHHVTLSFISRLRDEKRFANVDALLNQVHQDIQVARKILQMEGQ